MKQLPQLKCAKCGESWTPRTSYPKACPNCKARNWDMPTRKGGKDH